MDREQFKVPPMFPTIPVGDAVMQITAMNVRPPITIAGQLMWPCEIRCENENGLDKEQSMLAARSLEKQLTSTASVNVDSMHEGTGDQGAILLILDKDLAKAEKFFKHVMSQIARQGLSADGAQVT